MIIPRLTTYWLVSFTLLFGVSHLMAQDTISFDQLNESEGLSYNFVRAIAQDQNGFLWIGTSHSLNRYDGIEFKTYYYNPADPHSISSNDIYSLMVDRNDNLWVGTVNDGLSVLPAGSKKFRRYYYDKNDSTSISNNFILSLYEDRQGTIWIGTNYGLNKYVPESDSFVRYQNDPDDPTTISDNLVYSMLEDRKGRFWVATQFGGLNLFDRSTGRFTAFRHDPDNPGSISSDFVFTVYEDLQGTIWVGTYRAEMCRFEEETNSFTRFAHDPDDPKSISTDFTRRFHEDRDGLFWVATSIGLNLMDREAGTFQRILRKPGRDSSLSDNFCTSILEDHSGLIWIGGFDGVNKLNKRKNKFKTYLPDYRDETWMQAEWVSCFLPIDDDRILVGSYGEGVTIYNSVTRTFSNYPKDKIGKTIPDVVVSMLKDSEGKIWFGTGDEGIGTFNLESGRYTKMTSEMKLPNRAEAQLVRTFHIDAAGMFWIGSNLMLYSYDPESNETSSFYYDPDDPDSLSSNLVNYFHEDISGDLWIATRKGLNLLNRKTKIFKKYFHDPDDPASLSNDYVNFVFRDRSGTMWFATDAGLNRYNREKDNFVQNPSCPELYDYSINTIAQDEEGNFWLGTVQGLGKYNPQTGELKTFNRNDGLPGNDFNIRAVARMDDGELYFGSTNGFTCFYPRDISFEIPEAKVLITDFAIFDKPYSDESEIWGMENVKLTIDQNFFTIDFRLMEYSFPNDVTFAYRLDTFDASWVLNTNGRANYTAVPPGNYTFRVAKANAAGEPEGDEAQLKIIIKPPFWMEWWFNLAIVMFVVSLITALIYRRNMSQRKQREVLQQMVQEKTRELEEKNKELETFSYTVSHDLKSPLRNVNSYCGIILDEYKDEINSSIVRFITKIKHATVRMNNLIEKLLKLSRIGVRELSYETFNLSLLAKSILHDMTEAEPERKVEIDVEDDCFVTADLELVTELMANLLGNAWKFTCKKDVGHICFGSEPGNMETIYYIRDNGAGFDPLKEEHLFIAFKRLHGESEFGGSGIGLATVKKVVELHDGRIWAEGKPEEGATFYFTLGPGKQ